MEVWGSYLLSDCTQMAYNLNCFLDSWKIRIIKMISYIHEYYSLKKCLKQMSNYGIMSSGIRFLKNYKTSEKMNFPASMLGVLIIRCIRNGHIVWSQGFTVLWYVDSFVFKKLTKENYLSRQLQMCIIVCGEARTLVQDFSGYISR